MSCGSVSHAFTCGQYTTGPACNTSSHCQYSHYSRTLARTQNHVPVEVATSHAMECRTLGRWSRAPCCMTTWAPASRLGPRYCKFLS